MRRKRVTSIGLVVESKLDRVEHSGKCSEDLVLAQPISATQHLFGFKQHKQADQYWLAALRATLRHGPLIVLTVEWTGG